MTSTWWPPRCARPAPFDAASALLSHRSVPQYDAFGREIGANTLSGLGSGVAPEAEAAPVETGPPEPSPPRPEPPSVSIPLRPLRRRRRRGAGFVVLFVLFIVLAPLAIGGLVIFSAVDGATEAVRKGVATIAAPEVSAAAAVPPMGVRGRSLVRRDHFAAALASLSGSELRLTHLRLAPERIDAQLLTRGGRLRSVQVLPGGATKRLGPDSGPGFDSAGTIPISRLDPRAPQRLARRGAAKLRVRLSTLQYLVPTLFSGKVTWVAYFEHARYVLGDAAGRYQRAFP
jgi:hypothetical protein